MENSTAVPGRSSSGNVPSAKLDPRWKKTSERVIVDEGSGLTKPKPEPSRTETTVPRTVRLLPKRGSAAPELGGSAEER